ncbi:MAG: substrate-binding domain-containing protein, partial [Eubacteriales bacterium]|nr:substrate-binding domain-containing protein [Eubacteriales bacterium]
ISCIICKRFGFYLSLDIGNYDASRQNSQVEQMIRDELDGILMIPQDSEICVEGAKTARKAGIPVVSVNTRVNSNEIISYVGSNDIEAGELVAKGVAEVLNGTGNVVILEGPIGQSAQTERLEGIKKVLAEYPDVHVIGNKTANWSRLEAKNMMQKWLQTFDRIDAVIAENDDMALGALEAIEAADQEIYVVGIDGSEEGLQAVEDGRMYMTVFQDAEKQSKKALEVIVKHIKGEAVEENYWIPLEEITAE